MGAPTLLSALPIGAKAAGLTLVLLTLGGSLLRKEAIAVAFDPAEHAPWQAKGTAHIDGEGFLRRPNAFLARCSGGIVYLLPDTTYFREFLRIRKSGVYVENDPAVREAFAKGARQTQCNMNGRFYFEDLPAGKWHVALRISYEGEAWRDQSSLLAEIETKSGEVSKVILSNPNRI